MNLDIWNQLKQPPDWALKKITGGRLNGKSDISPAWRIQAMTEAFGPCGIGWKYELKDKWTQEANGQILLFVEVNLFVKVGDGWSAAIPGFGGDFLIEKESSGLHANDEAMKMAVTDALGNAMKNLGVAAVVFSGGTDGTKYNRQSAPAQPPKPPTTKSDAKQPTLITEAQLKKLFATVKDVGWTAEQAKESISITYGVDSSKQLTTQQASEFIDFLSKQKGEGQ